ncbi:hypothetical protein RSSM_00227 [Rhodopirellula sallentina SM41]|uniref:Uncharacterized protein n=1 Tax=Rhodopirellula sallentina SM41 TaxID=1263870 RepID=M5UA89_9BACT|nr:hypothetical protein RSSM_00227 [Rhodopirellula sallentina SM41]
MVLPTPRDELSRHLQIQHVAMRAACAKCPPHTRRDRMQLAFRRSHE